MRRAGRGGGLGAAEARTYIGKARNQVCKRLRRADVGGRGLGQGSADISVAAVQLAGRTGQHGLEDVGAVAGGHGLERLAPELRQERPQLVGGGDMHELLEDAAAVVVRHQREQLALDLLVHVLHKDAAVWSKGTMRGKDEGRMRITGRAAG